MRARGRPLPRAYDREVDTMGLFSNRRGRSYDYEYETPDDESEYLPELHNGMTVSVESEGIELFSGRIAGYTPGDTVMTLERLPRALSFKILDLGASVILRGCDEEMQQFILKGAVQESTRLVCRFKDIRVKPIQESRENFRLMLHTPAELYYMSDDKRTNPEDCTLVNISTGGACLESEYLHAEDEVLRLKVKLQDYVPMEFVGEIIRVLEYEPGRFRYGFLFAQLRESERVELTRTLYNLQVGNRTTWMRTEEGYWSDREDVTGRKPI